MFNIFNSLFYNDLPSFSVRCPLPAVRCFSTKRAGSPLYRETQFFCARGTGFQPVKTRPCFDFELSIMSYRKFVFFARLKRWMACLWPSCGRRQILRLSLLKKQDMSSTPSRAKTVLTRVKKISVTSVSSVAIKNYLCGCTFSQKY